MKQRLVRIGLTAAFLAVVNGGQVQSVQAAQGEAKEKSTRVRVGGNVAAANLIHKVTPVYPPQAKAERRQGSVMLSAIILKDGTVGSLDPIPPAADSDLTASAMDAVQQWRYKPTLLNGEPVEIETTIEVRYTLSQ